MDPIRAYVYLLTGGTDGRSPHAALDVVSVLRVRGRTVVVHGVSVGPPPSLHVSVDGHYVHIRPGFACDNAAGECWFFAALCDRMVRINAGRTVEVPHGTVDGEPFDVNVALADGWMAKWPTALDVEGGPPDPVARIARYAFRLLSQERAKDPGHFAVCGRHTFPYVSETALADGVEMLLTVPRA